MASRVLQHVDGVRAVGRTALTDATEPNAIQFPSEKSWARPRPIRPIMSTDENRLLFAHRGGMLTSEMKPSKSNKIQINPK